MAKGRLNFKVEEDVTKKLNAMSVGLKSPEITKELQRGAEIMASAARQRAPVRTGALKQGVYTASQLKDNRPNIQRGSKAQDVVTRLRFPPRKGQVVVVSGTFYGRWVEKGRKRVASGSGDGLKVRSVGRMRKRPFFKPGIRAARASAESYVARRLERIVMEKAR